MTRKRRASGETDAQRREAEAWYTYQRKLDEWASTAVKAGTGITPPPNRPAMPPIVVTAQSRISRVRVGSLRWQADQRKIARELISKTRSKPREGWSYRRKQIRWMDADPCVYCGGVADTYDHITPRKRGGDHSDDNLARCCQSCNHEKTSRPLLLFLAIRAQRKADGTWKRMPELKLRSGSLWR